MGSRVHSTSGSLQRSRSDIDVNAASSAKSRLSTVPASSPFSSAAALPPGSYASLGTEPEPRTETRTSRLCMHRVSLFGFFPQPSVLKHSHQTHSCTVNVFIGCSASNLGLGPAPSSLTDRAD